MKLAVRALARYLFNRMNLYGLFLAFKSLCCHLQLKHFIKLIILRNGIVDPSPFLRIGQVNTRHLVKARKG